MGKVITFIKDKPQFGWVMYDWANSAFATTVMAGFFPVFFKEYWSSTADVNISTAYLALSNSLASLIVAVLAPVLGAIADQGNARKRFLLFFAYMAVLMTGCLFMVDMGNWPLALFLYIMGTIGFSGANVFYDSLLPDIASKKNIDFISSKGYAYGYLGGGLLFLLNVLWYTMPANFGFETEFNAQVLSIDNHGIYVNSEEFVSSEMQDFEADLASHFTSEIKAVESDGIYVYITLSKGNDLDLKGMDEVVSFGKYKSASFVSYDAANSLLTVKDLTRTIGLNDIVDISYNHRLKIGNYKDGLCSNVTGLSIYYDNMTLKTDMLKPAKEFLPIRLSFLSVAFWWAIFTIPLILWVKEAKHSDRKPVLYYVKKGFGQLGHTFHKVRQMKYIFTFLAAYWLYIDGVNTVIRMAVDYGMSIGLPSSSLIIALLITQFVGFPSALFFGKLGEKWSVKNSLFIGIIVYLGINIWAVFMSNSLEFYIMAIIIGVVQGGIQALSRSMYSRLIPKNQNAEYFGFLNMTGKFAAIFGPLMVGVINLITKNMGLSSNLGTRLGIGSLVLLFIGGGIFLYFVDIEKGKNQAEMLSN